jgi:hypothetical protein
MSFGGWLWRSVLGSMDIFWLENPERMSFSALGPMESMYSIDFSGPKALNEIRSGFLFGSSLWNP